MGEESRWEVGYVCVGSEGLEDHREVVVCLSLVVSRNSLRSCIELGDGRVDALANEAILGLEQAVALNEPGPGNVIATGRLEAEVVRLRDVESTDKVDERAWQGCADTLEGCHEIVLVVIRREVVQTESAARTEVVRADVDGQDLPVVRDVHVGVLVDLGDQIGNLSANHISNKSASFGSIVSILVRVVASSRTVDSVAYLCGIGSSGNSSKVGIELRKEV